MSTMPPVPQRAADLPHRAGALLALLFVGATLLALVLVSQSNYLLFHGLAELISICVAWSVFVLAWTSRRHRLADNGYLLVLGISSLFVGGIDLVHTLAYRGMGVFGTQDANLATQLWIAARYLQGLSLLMASALLYSPPKLVSRRPLTPYALVLGYAGVTTLLVAGIFGGVFPVCYVEGVGLTPFKRASEYAISGILLLAMLLLWRRRERLEPDIVGWLLVVIGATIGAELAFTLYVDIFDLSNMVGHLLKIAAFAALYRAIVITGIERPATLLFRALAASEEEYRHLAENLQDYVMRYDRQHRHLYTNQAALLASGKTLDEFIGKTHREMGFPEDLCSLWEKAIDRVFETGQPQREMFEWDSPQGRIVLDWRVTPEISDGAVVSVLGVSRDITEIRRAEQALRESQIELAAIYENAPIMMLVVDQERRIRRVNGSAQGITGVRAEDMIGLRWGEAVCCWNSIGAQGGCGTGPMCAECAMRRMLFDTLETGATYTQVETCLPFAVEGRRQERHFLISTTRLSLTGEPLALISVLDITKRVRAEQALRANQALLDETQRIARLGGWSLDVETGAVHWTDEVYRIHEVPPEFDPAIESALGFYAPEDRRILKADIHRAIETGKNYDRELRLITARGRELVVRGVGRAEFQDGRVVRLSGTIQDVTERVLAQAALRKAHDELERRVQERTQELTVANQELLAVSRSERQQRELAETLIEAMISLSSSLELDQVLGRILDRAAHVIPCQGVAVLTIQDRHIRLARHSGFDDHPEALEALRKGFPLDTFPLLEAQFPAERPGMAAEEETSARWLSVPGMEWLDCLTAPLTQPGERPMGLLSVFSEQPDLCSADSPSLLQAFASHAAIAIQNAQLYEAALRARLVAETLSATSLAVTQSLDLDPMLDTSLEHVHRLVPYDSASILLPQEESVFAVHAARGYDSDEAEGAGVTGAAVAPKDNPLLRTLLEERQSVLVTDTREHPYGEHPLGAAHALCWMSVPLVAGDRVIGICFLDKREPGFFDPEHVRLAEALAGQTAVAIQNAWLFEQVRAGRERLQSLARRLVEVQETERRYVARELHDEAGQALTSLVIGLRLLAREAQSPEAIVANVVELERIVNNVIEDLHRLAMDLRPASLDYVGLVAALRQYCESLSDKHGLATQLEVVRLDQRLPPEVETALYRIVQEALTNVVRHARATRVDVLLEQRDHELIVIVEDNGIGFPIDEFREGHLGLVGMHERIEMLGGTLTIESTPDVGTTVRVRTPYGNTNSHR